MHGHTSVEKKPGPHLLLQIGHMCTCVGTGGGEGQVKGGGSRVHLLKEVKSKMMTGGACNDAPRT